MRFWQVCFAVSIVGLFSVRTECQISKWNLNLPIESTAEQVKKTWGEPLETAPDTYRFHDFNIMVNYASGVDCEAECIERGRSCGWSVPRDTLITIVFAIKVPMRLRDLGIDVSAFKRGKASDYGDSVALTSDEKGMSVIVQDEEITSIALFPAKKYFHLMCPNGNERPMCPAKVPIAWKRSTFQFRLRSD
jgi:hypothetical protein